MTDLAPARRRRCLRIAVPAGPYMRTMGARPGGKVPPLSCSDTFCPAIALKVTAAFCPATVVDAVTGGPSTLVVYAASSGTNHTRAVIDPVAVPVGSMNTLYVPVADNVTASNRHDDAHDKDPN